MSTVRVDREDDLARVTLDRPPVNAIVPDFAREVDAAFARLESDDVGAVILTGAGPAFSAGLDLKAVPGYDAAQRAELARALGAMLIRVYGFPRPVVAAVNGHCIAGGLVLALACDYRIAADAGLRIGLTEARVGIPFPRVPSLLVRAELGDAARFFMLTARNVGPGEARQRGAIDEVCDADELQDRARDVAAELAAHPRDAYRRIKADLRGETLARMRDALEDDATLDGWRAEETRKAAGEILGSGEA